MQEVNQSIHPDHSIAAIQHWVADDLIAVNTLIEERLESKIPLIKQICQHIIQCGGKRLRPMVVLLSARACGYMGTQHIELAAIVEMLHTATLLHDDVVDSAELRRGIPTANIKWGNVPSILVGDFLYSRIFQMMTELNRMPILSLLANTTNSMAEGEMLQLMNRNEPDTTEESYMQVIEYKTAALFAASAKLGAIIADQSPAIQHSAYAFGHDLGIAFQLIDDSLDYSASTQDMGKTIGNDLAEGKLTLPLIYALKQANKTQRTLIENALRDPNEEQFALILETIQETHALSYIEQLAMKHAKQALNYLSELKESPYKQALRELVEFAIQRAY